MAEIKKVHIEGHLSSTVEFKSTIRFNKHPNCLSDRKKVRNYPHAYRKYVKILDVTCEVFESSVLTLKT